MEYAMVKRSLQSFFDRFFPPPNFLRMPALGIDISDNVIRFMEFGRGNNGARYVKNFGEKKLIPGSISSGFINKPENVVEVLAEIKKETGAVFANVSLPEEKAYLFKMQVPKLYGADLRDAVGFRIEENAPVTAKEAYYDFIVLGNNLDGSDHLDLVVSVIPSKVSEAYAHVVKASGFVPMAFEIGSQAIGRAVVSPYAKGSFLVISLGELKTGLAVVYQGAVFFTSTAQVGSQVLDEAMANKYNIPLKEIAGLKLEIASNGKQDMKLFLEYMESLAPLKEEIKKLVAYWKTHSANLLGRQNGIDKMILCGKDVSMPAFDEYFFASTGIKTEVANVWRNVFSFEEYVPPLSYRDSLDYAGAIGLAVNS